jgi:hypothetical protein
VIAPKVSQSRELQRAGEVNTSFASIGVVMVFDEDIGYAIRRGPSDTLTNIFDNVQPLGNEYAIGIVGTFYLWGEIFKDPRANRPRWTASRRAASPRV